MRTHNLLLERLVGVVLLLIFYSYPIRAEQDNTFIINPKESDAVKIEKILNQLGSSDWKEREKVIHFPRRYEIGKLFNDERVKVKLISILEEETKRYKTYFKNPLTMEEYDTNPEAKRFWIYYRDLTDIVAITKDKKASSVLVNSEIWGEAEVNALKEIGEPAIVPLLSRFRTEKHDQLCRDAIVSILNSIVKKHNISIDSKNKISDDFINSLKNKKEDSWVKKSVIEWFGYVKDKRIIPLLRQIIKEDIHTEKKTINGKEVKYYPIREEAERVLTILKQEENSENEKQ